MEWRLICSSLANSSLRSAIRRAVVHPMCLLELAQFRKQS
jgi:hypothetical protein